MQEPTNGELIAHFSALAAVQAIEIEELETKTKELEEENKRLREELDQLKNG